jgi:hypothetical protein
MRRTFLIYAAGAFLVLGFLTADPDTAPAQTEDHLKCYKVKDELILKPPAGADAEPEWLKLTGTQFGEESCKIVGGFRLFCVPVAKDINHDPRMKLRSETGVPPYYVTPEPFVGPVEEDKLCYKIKCEEPPPGGSQEVTDQFASRTVERMKPFLVCGPAVKGLVRPERFVDNGDGTVTDNQTGLMWEKKEALDTVEDPNNPHDADNYYNWSATAAYNPDGAAFCDFLGELNNCVDDGTFPPTGVTGGFAGHCDWRLPTIVELQTILIEPTHAIRTPASILFSGRHRCSSPGRLRRTRAFRATRGSCSSTTAKRAPSVSSSSPPFARCVAAGD